MFYLKEEVGGIIFRAFILPKSSRNMISGLHGDAMKIKLTAPPVDGAANKLCIKYLSKLLKIPKNRIEIVAGHTGRHKTILVRYRQDTDASGERESIRNLLLSLVC